MNYARFLPILLLALVANCTTFVPPPQISEAVGKPATTKADAIAAWQRVLTKFVDESGRINFALVQSNPQDLHIFVDWISRNSPESSAELFHTADERLAYYLDSYNALAMFGVIAAGIPAANDSFWKRASFFKFTSYKIGGSEISLYDYENGIIRPLGDPRVHFALNCMSVGCPRLPQTAFMSLPLNEELDRAAREFFNSPKYMRLDAEAKIVYLSEILSFFTGDFVNPKAASSLIAFANQYADEKAPEDFRVEFIPYDWTMNRQ